MILLFLLINTAMAADHSHHEDKLKASVDQASKVVAGKIVVSPEFCPAADDPAFINFNPEQLKDGPGFHGMLFFGTDTFYISHLPMFMSPHDYQAIVEVRLPPAEKAKYLASAKANGGYFTFAPDDTFVLPKIMTEKSKIRGKLVQGHFERGGTTLTNVELDLVRVVLYKKLSAKEPKPKNEKYVVFGNGKEYFAAHIVAQRPNVDEIIPIPDPNLVTPAMQTDIKQHGVLISNEVEVKGGKVNLSKDPKQSFPYKEFYRETGDLE